MVRPVHVQCVTTVPEDISPGKLFRLFRDNFVPFRGNFGVNIFENGHFRRIFFLTPDLDSSRPSCGSCQLYFTFSLSKLNEIQGGTRRGKI